MFRINYLIIYLHIIMNTYFWTKVTNWNKEVKSTYSTKESLVNGISYIQDQSVNKYLEIKHGQTKVNFTIWFLAKGCQCLIINNWMLGISYLDHLIKKSIDWMKTLMNLNKYV